MPETTTQARPPEYGGATGSERLLSHEEFLQQYVLNRAAAHEGGLKASCVEQAEAAWQRIQQIIQNDQVEARRQ